MTDSPTALLLSGSGRYADPWHPFARTSDALADIARQRGMSVTRADDVDDALAALAVGPLPDLVIADLGRPRDGAASPATGAATAGLTRLLQSRPLFAAHAAASSFPDSSAWAAAVGARWVPGTSWHPDYGTFQAVPLPAYEPSSPIGALVPFELEDERYLDLRQDAPARTILYGHHGDDAPQNPRHPSIWLQDRGGVRSAYDAYGHDTASYDVDEHRDVIGRILTWLSGMR